MGQVTVNAGGGLKFITPNVGHSTGAGSITDANGNQISISSGGVITDTLNTTALTVTGSAPNPVTYAYTAPSGSQVNVEVTYVQYSVQTCFQVSGVNEYPATQVPLVDRVTLPDTSFYQFYYEPTVGCGTTGKTTGRIASVTLPTGGTITYTYGSTNSMMADGSPSSMTRGLSNGTWTYGRAEQPNETNPQQM
jgi:hypothetical protein